MRSEIIEAVKTYWPWNHYRMPNISKEKVKFIIRHGKPGVKAKVTSLQTAKGPVTTGYRIQGVSNADQ